MRTHAHSNVLSWQQFRRRDGAATGPSQRFQMIDLDFHRNLLPLVRGEGTFSRHEKKSRTENQLLPLSDCQDEVRSEQVLLQTSRPRTVVNPAPSSDLQSSLQALFTFSRGNRITAQLLLLIKTCDQSTRAHDAKASHLGRKNQTLEKLDPLEGGLRQTCFSCTSTRKTQFTTGTCLSTDWLTFSTSVPPF